MTIRQLKEILNNIPTNLDHLNVWIDTEESEGGRIVNEVGLKFADDCCLDADDGCEYVYGEEILPLVGLTELPEENTTEFAIAIHKMQELNYRYEGDYRFGKQIFTIKF
jgi:hypothetical protein